MDDQTAGASALEGLAMLQAAVEHALTAVDESLWQVPEADLPATLDQVHALTGQMSALKLKVIREIDTRAVPATVGATSLSSYLQQRLRLSPGPAREEARLSESLSTRYADTGSALAAGRVGHEQAKAISDTLDKLPRKTTFEQREWAQEFLLGKAALFNAPDLRGLGKSIDNMIDPDGTPDREEAARSKRGLHVKDNHDGTQSLRWTDTDENMAFAKAALEALAKPLPGEETRPPRSPATPRRRHGRHRATRPRRRRAANPAHPPPGPPPVTTSPPASCNGCSATPPSPASSSTATASH
jgi:hypothetical protein